MELITDFKEIVDIYKLKIKEYSDHEASLSDIYSPDFLIKYYRGKLYCASYLEYDGEYICCWGKEEYTPDAAKEKIGNLLKQYKSIKTELRIKKLNKDFK